MGNCTPRLDATEKNPERDKVRPAQMKVANKLYCRLAPEYIGKRRILYTKVADYREYSGNKMRGMSACGSHTR